MTVRRATAQDLPELMRLAKQFHYEVHLKRLRLFEDAEAGWLAWFARCLESPAHALLVAEDADAQLVGFLTGLLGEIFWAPDLQLACETAWYVEKRGAGHGRALMEAFVDWGRRAGARLICAGSTQHSRPKRLHKVLRALGFRQEETHYTREVL
jgi:GNAT superfamily N-acetyltransferase